METELDKIKKAVRETVLTTVIGPEVLVEIAVILREFNIPTFLTKAAIEMLINRLTMDSSTQEAAFSLLTEFRYHLLTYGFQDPDVCKLVVDSVSVVTKSSVIPDDYKSLVLIPDEHKTDMMICLLYLLRVNVSYLEESIIAKTNLKENKK